MPYLLVPLALEVEVTLSGLPVVDDMVVVLAAALVTRPVLGVAVPPIGAVDWLLISCCIVKLNWPNMLVKLHVACTYECQWRGSSKTRKRADVRELGGERESGILRGLDVLANVDGKLGCPERSE